ncbi:MAG TPA: carboxypeptidase regulatory-like domain-containing protein [Jatrophihabitans sp.]|jgi:hypothetical protein
MRAATENRVVGADPGTAAKVVVDVVNTGEVIDGISANVIGLPPECATSTPAMLPLFPTSSGQLTVSLAIPSSYPAGRHPITVELVSNGAGAPSQFLDLDLDVAPKPSMAVNPAPRVVRARRSGRFVVEVKNDGNLPIDVALRAADVDRAAKVTFTPEQLRVEAGATVPVLLHVRGPRMFTGSEVERPVQVVATATRADLAPDADPSAADVEVAPRETNVRLRQRPLISRGMLTALVLLSIIALWAGVFLLGLTKVFSNDPMTKAAPASFFVATQGGSGGSGSGAQGARDNGSTDGNGAPAGSLPKSGQLPAGIGAQITGTVISASTEQPVGQILVEAYRASSKSKSAVSSAATQSDGTFTLAGLFPTQYVLKFSANGGFKPVWYPNAPSRAGSRAVNTQAQGTTTGINAVIRGLPASISGTVDPGDTLHKVQTAVTARPLDVAGGSARSRTVTTDAAGKYTITGLAAPASYQLTFTTPGYQTSTLLDTVNGGDQRIEATVTLGAAQGAISGVVVAGTSINDAKVGGATVSTTVGGKTISVLTPTAGAVGTFVIPNLPTPATYVLNYSAPGRGTWTEVVELAAGQSYAKALGKLTNGTGTINGIVRDGKSSAGLGGVTVTVGGSAASTTGDPGTSATAPTTTTLTNGNVGGFYFSGLPDGRYTVTFSLDGYTTASVPVTLDSSLPPGKRAPEVQVRLYKQAGDIKGIVYVDGQPMPGATITATDGTTTYTATSSAAGGLLPAGGYDLAALPPGTYSVTASAPGAGQQTRIVKVGRGKTVNGQNLSLTSGG